MQYIAYIVVPIVGTALWLIPPLLIAFTKCDSSSKKVMWAIASLFAPAGVFFLALLPLQHLAVRMRLSLSDQVLGWYSFVTWGFNILAFLAPVIVLWLFHRRVEAARISQEQAE